MFTDEEEKWARFRDLTEIMEKGPQQEPPEGFTERVMARLPEGKATVVRRFSFRRPFGTPAFATDMTLGFRRPVTKTECAFYFFLTGFAHLILASVLFWGFRNLNMENQTIIWLKIQPQLVLFLTCWLTVAGSVLMIGRTGLKLSMLASLLYIGIVSFNGFLLIDSIDKPVFRIPVFGLVGTTFLVGVFLVSVIQKQLEKKDYDKGM